MQIIHTVSELRTALAGKRSAFVPTMGNLHAGHLRLITRAVEEKNAGLEEKIENLLKSIVI